MLLPSCVGGGVSLSLRRRRDGTSASTPSSRRRRASTPSTRRKNTKGTTPAKTCAARLRGAVAGGLFSASRSNSVRCRRVARARSSTTPRWTATCWRSSASAPAGPAESTMSQSRSSRATFWRSWRKALAARSVVASGCVVARSAAAKLMELVFCFLVLLARSVRCGPLWLLGWCAEGQRRAIDDFLEPCDFFDSRHAPKSHGFFRGGIVVSRIHRSVTIEVWFYSHGCLGQDTAILVG